MVIDTSVKLNNVIGMEEAKERLIKRLVRHFKIKDKVKSPPSKGIILFGYPGTGKSMLVTAIINELSQCQNVLFKIVTVSDLTAYLGTTAKKIKKYFEDLNIEAKGRDIVLCMDEADELIPDKKGLGAIEGERVSTLLSELNGLENKNANIYIIATTNHPGRIEPAFTRSGRIDDHIQIKLPTESQRRELIKQYLNAIPGLDNVIDALLIATLKWTGADYKKLGNELEETYQYKLYENPEAQFKPEEIIAIVTKTAKLRKINFKTFEAEYKKYRNGE